MKKFLRYFIYLVLFSTLIGLFIYIGKKDFKVDISDGEKFSKEYSSIPVDNMFVYADSKEVLDIINNGSGIILMGFSSNIWMQEYVNHLYPVLKDYNIDKVYYYDLLADRTKKTKNYMAIEDSLQNFLKKNDSGNEYLYTPALLFIVNGKVLFYDDETSIVSYNESPDSYWTEYNISYFNNKISYYLEEMSYNE